MAILDNYMFRPLLVIFRLSSRQIRILLKLPLNSYACFNMKSVKRTFEEDGVPSSTGFILGGTEYIPIKFSNAITYRGLVVES